MLGSLATKQLPFATATALNELAFRAMRVENTAMSSVFKNPRPFTQKATQVERKATKAQLSAVVSIRPNRARYLAPFEFGGLHFTAGRALLLPVSTRLDQYGQLPRNAVKSLAGRSDIFVGTIQTKEGPVKGVWRRIPGKPGKRGQPAQAPRLKLLIRFTDPKEVTQHLDFVLRGRKVIEAEGKAAFEAAIARAIATSR